LLAISANSAWNLLNFRRGLIAALTGRGYELVALVPPGDGTEELERLGVAVIPILMSPRGLSPVFDLQLLASYARHLKELRPFAFLGFTAKPNIYGSMAAHRNATPVIANITGLGTGFLSGPALEFLLSRLYRIGLASAHTVFFHNPDDRDLFVSRGLCPPNAAKLIPGSGIDLARFEVCSPPGNEEPAFLFIGRFLKDKGISEFVEAARLVKERRPAIRFQALGMAEPHPKSISLEMVRQWEGEGVVEFLGTAADVRPFIAAADCVVLPSYREGLPRVLLEASAMGRAVIGTDVPGCRQALDDGVTGFLCTARSSLSLADAMNRFASLPEGPRHSMGRNARLKAEREFGEERVIDAYVAALEKLTAASPSVVQACGR
jgi:glycosyltransferase involved in cell wall biosynthesis